jgi:hypothetical protein
MTVILSFESLVDISPDQELRMARHAECAKGCGKASRSAQSFAHGFECGRRFRVISPTSPARGRQLQISGRSIGIDVAPRHDRGMGSVAHSWHGNLCVSVLSGKGSQGLRDRKFGAFTYGEHLMAQRASVLRRCLTSASMPADVVAPAPAGTQRSLQVR